MCMSVSTDSRQHARLLWVPGGYTLYHINTRMHVKSERKRQRGGGAKEQEREERSERGVFICIFEYTHEAQQDARLLSMEYQ